jgi:hypothetical protein
VTAESTGLVLIENCYPETAFTEIRSDIGSNIAASAKHQNVHFVLSLSSFGRDCCIGNPFLMKMPAWSILGTSRASGTKCNCNDSRRRENCNVSTIRMNFVQLIHACSLHVTWRAIPNSPPTTPSDIV